jgi:hypothetical protein
MLKLFKLEIGNHLVYAAAESLEDMTERKEEVDPTFAFLPVQIEEMTIEGYEITVTPTDQPKKTRTRKQE